MSYVIKGIRVARYFFGYKGCMSLGCGEDGTHFVVAGREYVFALYCEQDAKEAVVANASWLTAVVPREELE